VWFFVHASHRSLPSFAGKIETASLHPFPQVLSAEQAETLRSMVDPVTDFFANTNDAKQNDATGTVPPGITEALMEMGAFGL
jgi:hypothetical protein